VTIDEARRRVYAAHTYSRRLLVVDSNSGKVVAQVNVGPMHGSAVDPVTGDVFTGNGTDQSVSKVDATTLKVIAKADVSGNVDAIAYDPVHRRIYADQDGGGSVYVIDAATMKTIATLAMPTPDLESLAVDPATGIVYQNLSTGGGFAIIDPTSLKVVKVVTTPQLQKNHPLIFSRAANQVVTGGINGMISAYTPGGEHVGDAAVQEHIDQCSTGSQGKFVACAGRGIVTVVELASGAAPRVVGRLDTGHTSVHTVGVDESTGDIWIVYADENGDWVQRLKWNP
jgi:DNA-binding beta-propeller fold protein YncE